MTTGKELIVRSTGKTKKMKHHMQDSTKRGPLKNLNVIGKPIIKAGSQQEAELASKGEFIKVTAPTEQDKMWKMEETVQKKRNVLPEKKWTATTTKAGMSKASEAHKTQESQGLPLKKQKVVEAPSSNRKAAPLNPKADWRYGGVWGPYKLYGKDQFQKKEAVKPQEKWTKKEKVKQEIPTQSSMKKVPEVKTEPKTQAIPPPPQPPIRLTTDHVDKIITIVEQGSTNQKDSSKKKKDEPKKEAKPEEEWDTKIERSEIIYATEDHSQIEKGILKDHNKEQEKEEGKRDENGDRRRGTATPRR